MFDFPQKYADRYWSKIDKDGPLLVKELGRCWSWLAGCTKAGYGQLVCRKVCQMPLLAHRVSWALNKGPIPDGEHVLHKCDNPQCSRPNHLFLGTQKDNNLDRDTKGRTASGDRNGARTKPRKNSFIRNRGSGKKGESHPMRVLTWETVQRIRLSYSNGFTNKSALGRKFGTSNVNVDRIIKRRIWNAKS